MPICFVSIGSNVERERNVRGARCALHEAFGPLLLSAVYETDAVGFAGDPFYNLVAGFFTELPAADVANILTGIEAVHGREHGGKRFAPRTLDLDLLLYGDTVIVESGLTLPRPEIETYAFMLGPLAEIAHDLRHPSGGETYATTWERSKKSGARPARTVRFEL